MASIANIAVNVTANVSKFTSDMSRAARISKQKTDAMKRAFKQSAVAIGAAAASAGAATAKMVADFTREADKYSKLVDKLGGSTEAWSELEFAAERSGVKFEQLSMGMQRMTRRLGEAAALGKGEAIPALDRLGLSADKLIKLPIDKQFEAIAEELSKIPNESERAAIAMKFFDSEGVNLVQLAKDGAAGIQALREEAARFGVTISTEAAAQAVYFADRLTDLDAIGTGMKNTFVQEVLPAIINLADEFTYTGESQQFAAKAGENMAKIMRDGGAVAVLLGKGMASLGGLIMGVGDALLRWAFDVVTPVLDSFRNLGTAIRALAERDFLVAGAAFASAKESLSGLSGVGDSLFNDVQTSWSEAVDGLAGGFEAYDRIMGVSITTTGDLEQAMRDAADATEDLDVAVSDADPVLQEITKTADGMDFSLAKIDTTYDDLSQKIKDLSPKMAEDVGGVAAVWEGAWQRLDQTFADFWTNIFENGKISLDGLKDLFKQTLAQMLHAAITQPIVLRIGAVMGLGGASGSAMAGQSGGVLGGLMDKVGGFFDDWNLADAGFGALLGNAIYDSVGGTLGGAAGAWAGALYGGIVGGPVGEWIGKILGGAVGGLLGDLFGGLFESDPLPALQIAGMGAGVQGKIGSYGNMRRNFDTAFGTFQITNAQDGAQEAVEDVIQAMTDFHEAMASFMTPAQLETVKQNFAEFGHEWTNDAITIENVISQQFKQLLNHFEFLTAGVKDYVNSFTGLEQRTEAFARYVKAFNAMSIALAEYARSDIRSLVQVEMDTRSSAQRLADFGLELRTAIDEFDRTPEAFDRITAAISNRYSAEIEFIQAIDSLINQIGASIERQRASLRGQLGLDAARTPEQVLADAKRAMAGLSRAGSPEEIASIVSNVQALLDAAVRNAPEELAKGAFGLTRDEVIGQALGILDALESSATSRANVLRENAVAEAIALREEAAAFAAEQHIDLEAIQTSTDATTTAINDQTVVISQGNDSITEKLDRLIGLMSDSKSGFDDVVVRGVS